MTTSDAPALGELAYLYVGSDDVERDVAWYVGVLGAERLWAFDRFGARVAGLRVGPGPALLLADHRQAPSCMPVYRVADLDARVAELRERGWRPDAGPFEIPPGPCFAFRDPSGNALAIFADQRPDEMERAFADPDNPHAWRETT